MLTIVTITNQCNSRGVAITIMISGMTTPHTVLISCVILYVYFTVQLQYNYWTVAIYVCVQHMTGNHMTDKQPSINYSIIS